jgi:DMSO/TMAO reductase YedYZ molybdopterin-dependent catalytic subunit
MRFPWANTFLLLAILLQIVTGYLGFTSGRENERWLLWLHSIGAYAIVLVLLWKSSIILNVYRHKIRWNLQRVAFAIMAGLLILTLLSGLFWTFFGPKYLLGFSYVTIHIFLAVILFLLVGWHLISYRWILKVPEARDRRAFLRTTFLATAGFAAWQLSNLTKRGLSLPGSERRFTGSYEVGSFSPNFPQVSWINDNPAPIEIKNWRLVLSGATARPLTLTHQQLLKMPRVEKDVILDCTGGWYSAQNWSGIPFSAILELIQPDADARSVSFESITGYSRRFGLEESAGFLLATHVGGGLLSHGHGFPLRLVIPGERGVYWVKWLNQIQLNTGSKYWQSPLPLQ